MQDKTIIEKKNDVWVVRVNPFTQPLGIPMPMKNNDKVRIDPGITYNKDGKVIVSKDKKPLLVPALVYIDGNTPHEEVLKIVADIKEKEKSCPICNTIKEQVSKGNVTPAGEDAKQLFSKEELEQLLAVKDNKEELSKIIIMKAKGIPITQNFTQPKSSNDIETVVESKTKNKRSRPKRHKSKEAKEEKTTVSVSNNEDGGLFRRFKILEELRPRRIFR